MTAVQLVRSIFPDHDDAAASVLLWEFTAYPFSDEHQLRSQLEFIAAHPPDGEDPVAYWERTKREGFTQRDIFGPDEKERESIYKEQQKLLKKRPRGPSKRTSKTRTKTDKKD